jgi:Subtilase family
MSAAWRSSFNLPILQQLGLPHWPATDTDGHRGTLATGHDIALGVIDYGFDILHPCLRDPETGRSRFIALSDQNSRNFGTADFDRMIATGEHSQSDLIYDPHAHYFDTTRGRHGAHGTLMASIAGGSALGRFRGAAPGAALYGVHLALAEPGWKEIDAGGRPTWLDWNPTREPVWSGWKSYLGAPAIADALAFLVEVATRDRREALVINMSLGTWAGAHDATSPVAACLAEIEARSRAGHGPVVAVVTCTGNAGADRGHCHMTLPAGAHGALTWHVRRQSSTAKKLEIWYRSAVPVAATLSLPAAGGGAPMPVNLAPGPTVDIRVAGHRIGVAEHRCHAAEDLSCIRIALDSQRLTAITSNTAPSPATWDFKIDVHAGQGLATLHAWIERDDASEPDLWPQSWLSPNTPTATLSGLAAIPGLIVTAALGPSGDTTDDAALCAAAYSGRGPHPWHEGGAGRVPHIAVPGTMVWGAKSKSQGLTQTTGSSAAGALAAGALAVAMQAARDAARAGGREARGPT